ncbi:hypothetical protein QY881_05945 [Latilactobacillus sakei]|uniref:hypothetical protein n=1 Tax=Latilactobacillus TaxID=2767885 RepID=UPI00019CF271|nr:MULTISPECIES: hypothetical protein [Latilactobacillus]ARJ71376.1 hypothetical protein LP065_01860 [Latilactobacillus sakei]AST83732.1 hypothetical protein LBS_03985 [Latilactobacillus sakei]AWZ47148.1 hypothetical protein CXB69_09375 [Latilactobacillus sakei]AYG16873.1 hypothetical protein CFK78_07865 [Latilactobacillus sakei]AYG25595.1 hypothetical protein CFM83_05600 [Latilactobacillus sakei]
MNNPQFQALKVEFVKYAILTLFLFVMRAFIAHPIIIIASWLSTLVCVGYFVALVMTYHYR